MGASTEFGSTGRHEAAVGLEQIQEEAGMEEGVTKSWRVGY